MSVSDGSRRVFFALWPEAEIRRGLVERRSAIEGLSTRRVPDHNLHATLLFLGDQPSGLVDALLEAMPAAYSAADVSPFTLRLDRFGWFARARVAWLGGLPAAAGRTLVARLADEAGAVGIGAVMRAWVPHVTLFRDVGRKPRLPQPEPLDWRIDRFALVESIANRPYQVLRIWPLE